MPEKNVGTKNSSAAAASEPKRGSGMAMARFSSVHARQRQHRQCGQRRGCQQQAQLRQAGVVLRVAAAGQVAQRQRQHEDGDQRAPHIDAAAEIRRQQAAAQQLHAHHEEAGPEGDQVAERHGAARRAAAIAHGCSRVPDQGPAAGSAALPKRPARASSAPDHAGAPRPPPTVRRHRPTAHSRPSAAGAAPRCRPDSAPRTASSCARSAAARGHRLALLRWHARPAGCRAGGAAK